MGAGDVWIPASAAWLGWKSPLSDLTLQLLLTWGEHVAKVIGP